MYKRMQAFYFNSAPADVLIDLLTILAKRTAYGATEVATEHTESTEVFLSGLCACTVQQTRVWRKE